MSELPDRNDLLDDIEVRQDDLLRKLDELNSRIEIALKAQTAALAGKSEQELSPNEAIPNESETSPELVVAVPESVPSPMLPIVTSVAAIGVVTTV